MINLSNHSSENWGEKQKTAAALWCCGHVVDMPFPQIPPSATEFEVAELAEKYFKEIKMSGCNTVHLMGEMTFVVSLILRLRDAGYEVIASTTERKAVEKTKADGSVEKTAVFEFIKFRAYFP